MPLMINTVKYADTLEKSGIPRAQAEAYAKVTYNILNELLARTESEQLHADFMKRIEVWLQHILVTLHKSGNHSPAQTQALLDTVDTHLQCITAAADAYANHTDPH